MKESFIFYDSFLNAIDELDKETQLEVYQAITHYALRGEEPSLNGVAKAIFHLIKPQIDANNKRYEDGCKGAEYGKLGGRPRKNKEIKNPTGVISENPTKTPNENENVNENENENVLSYESKEKKESELSDFIDPKIDFFKSSQKTDPFVLADKVKEEYKQIIGKDLFLDQSSTEKLMSLYIATPDFLETLNSVMWNLKALQDLWKPPKPIGLGFSPPFSWLLKENFKNYSDIRNGVYDEQIAKWRKEYRLKRSKELAEQIMKEEQSEVCCG